VGIAKDKAFLRSPAHPYTKALLSAVPSLDPKKRREEVIPEGDIPSLIHPSSGCRFHTRCRKALLRCYDEEPFYHQAEDGRWVACHLYP